jgi:hypothetical protein
MRGSKVVTDIPSVPAPCPDLSATEAIRAALFEPAEADAYDNLEGALIDIKRFSEQGKPTDSVCIRTILRVLTQLNAVHNIVAPLSATKPAQRMLISQLVIETCAKIAEPWLGFPTTEPNEFRVKLTDVDKAVIEVRKEIAANIRAMAFTSTSGPVTTEQLDQLQFGRSLHTRPTVASADGKTPIPATDRKNLIVGQLPQETIDLIRASRMTSTKPCSHAPIIGLNGEWRCQHCGDVIEMATAFSSADGKNL